MVLLDDVITHLKLLRKLHGNIRVCCPDGGGAIDELPNIDKSIRYVEPYVPMSIFQHHVQFDMLPASITICSRW